MRPSSSLDQRLGAVEAAQARKVSPDAHAAMAQGYRFLGEVVGGVLGGCRPWLAPGSLRRHTQPWGLIGGLLIGAGLSIFVAVRSAAAKANKTQWRRPGPLPSVPDDEDED